MDECERNTNEQMSQKWGPGGSVEKVGLRRIFEDEAVSVSRSLTTLTISRDY